MIMILCPPEILEKDFTSKHEVRLMKYHFLHSVCIVGLAIGCLQASAQDAFVLTNSIDSAENATFTNSLGTASVTNGMIVFEGQLDADIIVTTNYNATSGNMLASLQLLVQVKLFDDLPASNEVGIVQGAVAALRDGTGLTTGKYYVWGSTNTVAPVMEWVPLKGNTNGIQFAVDEDSTNYITFVFNYSADPVTYQVFVGPSSVTQVASTPITTLTSDPTSQINGVSLLGTGALKTYASASGDIGPLSSSIGFSVYATANGMLLVLDPVNEQASSGNFTVYAWVNGAWVKVGEVAANGSGHYEFYADPGILQVGQSYTFKVVDELGNPHELAQAVEIKTIKMGSITMTPDYMTVTFNSEAGRLYQVISAESLTAETWTATTIYYPIAGGDFDYGSDPFTAATTTTTIRIPRNTTKGFFKIRKIN